jgi:hypothetical protein
LHKFIDFIVYFCTNLSILLFPFTQIYRFYCLLWHKFINFIVYFYTKLSILLFTFTQIYQFYCLLWHKFIDLLFTLISLLLIVQILILKFWPICITLIQYFFYRNVHVHLIFTIWACTCIVFKDSLCMHNHSKTKQILKIIWNLQETIKTWNAKLSINILEANKSAKTKTIFTI